MDEKKIAFVTEERKKRARLLFALLHRREYVLCLLEGCVPGALVETLPRRPAEAEHLVEDVGAFQRQRNRRLFAADFVFHVVFGPGTSFFRSRWRSAWKPRRASPKSLGMSQTASAINTASKSSMISGW